MPVPTKEQLVQYVKSNKYVNFSSIAKRFNINKATVQDLVDTYVETGELITVKQGSNKFVEISSRK